MKEYKEPLNTDSRVRDSLRPRTHTRTYTHAHAATVTLISGVPLLVLAICTPHTPPFN